MPLPLEGLLVVSLEQAVAAPYCSSRLADAGARVIKIERPEGDFARGYDNVVHGESAYFVWLNRGKESVILDLRKDTDRKVLDALVAAADVFIQNLKPGSLDRLGFGVAALRAKHPRLITVSVSGYGDSGPLAERKAYDLLIQAESGLASITGDAAGPARVGFSVVDIATGHMAYSAVLEALIAREKTGEGADIRLSMFDAMADWMTVPLLQAENGMEPKRAGLRHPSIAPYGVFTTRDGRPILISIQNEREWRVLCDKVFEDPGFATDPRFASNVQRVANRADTDTRCATHFARMDRDEAVARLDAADIAFAEVNDMAALSRHPHLRRVAVEAPSGPVAFPAPAMQIVGAERRYGAVPGLGAQDRAIKAEFGGLAGEAAE